MTWLVLHISHIFSAMMEMVLPSLKTTSIASCNSASLFSRYQHKQNNYSMISRELQGLVHLTAETIGIQYLTTSKTVTHTHTPPTRLLLKRPIFHTLMTRYSGELCTAKGGKD